MTGINNEILGLSFFTGAMGLDIGLERAGVKILLASEIDKPSCETIKLNRPEVALLADVRDYSAGSIRDAAGLSLSDEIHVVAGGPPCQAFSSAGRRLGFEDERGNVFLRFVELSLELQPNYILIENVRGLLSAPLVHRPHNKRGHGQPPLRREEKKGGALLFVIEMLREAGYGISFNLYNAANFGSPQVRERVILLCNREGIEMPYLTPTHSENGELGLPKWKTFREATRGLPDSPKDFVRFPEKRLRYYRMLKAGENWRKLPEELQKEALGNSYYAGGGKTGFLRRLSWDKPSPTLVTHPAMPATDLAHPEEDRPLTIQEYKRIQEFPDDWEIVGSLTDQYRQVGNAVPVSLGEAAGRTIVGHIRGKPVVLYPGFRYSRYKGTDHKSWEKTVRSHLDELGLSFGAETS